jgi:tetratricopeptide (TPR) repeat protein
MASLITGYQYDIFISYRQKDNKYDGWVTEFVDNLKRELEGTFKEDVSVYFDINPHDGLLETHDVDASLKEKLKCLVFIPIISRTYCDPKSFAWEHEFRAFVEEASRDQFGLKVKLPNGNIASRVLPVRIHDLDSNDIQLCESVVGGVLRGVEFVYKEPGVNRSLTPKDKEKKNLNGTIYRNQINKVALATREIIQGMTAGSEIQSGNRRAKVNFEEKYFDGKEDKLKKDRKPVWMKRILEAAFALAIIICGVIFIPKLFKQEISEKKDPSDKRIGIAVFPFRNMTNDSIWNNYQDIIQQNLISTLTFSPDIQVRTQGNISNSLFSSGYDEKKGMSSAFAGEISRKMEADIFVYGMIQKSSSGISIDAQLIETKTGEVIKSIKVNGPEKEEAIFGMIDTLSKNITDFLVLKKILKESWGFEYNYKLSITTRSPEALRNYIYGKKFQDSGDSKTALIYFLKSNEIDSNFYDPYIEIPSCSSEEENYRWLIKAYNKRDQWPPLERLYACWEYAFSFESPDVAAGYLEQILNIDDQDEGAHRLLGITYFFAGKYEKAVTEFEKYLELSKKWYPDIMKFYPNYGYHGMALHKTGQYEKEKQLYEIGEKNNPDDYWVRRLQAVLAFSQNDTLLANKYVERFITIVKKLSASDAVTEKALGHLYAQAGLLSRAKGHFLKALSFNTLSTGDIWEIAETYIERGMELNDIPQLMDKCMKLAKTKVEYYNYMNTKGYALFKMGKVNEALSVLQKVYDEAPYKIYSIKSHYEEVKKAVESQN